MKRQVLVAMIRLSAILLLSGCSTLRYMEESSYEKRVPDAERRLESMMQQIPVPPGAILVERTTYTEVPAMAECTGVGIHALFGTNEQSLGEVFDFYTSELQKAGWHLTLAVEKGRSFKMGDEFNLGVSNQYNVSHIRPETIRGAEGNFQTIYLFELNTSVLLPVPSRCEGG